MNINSRKKPPMISKVNLSKVKIEFLFLLGDSPIVSRSILFERVPAVRKVQQLFHNCVNISVSITTESVISSEVITTKKSCFFYYVSGFFP